MNLQKVTKTQLKAKINRLNEGEKLTVWLCPSNMRPSLGHPFNMAIEVSFSKDDINIPLYPDSKEIPDLTQFDSTINNFYVYNCTNETGRRIHYYIDGGSN